MSENNASRQGFHKTVQKLANPKETVNTFYSGYKTFETMPESNSSKHGLQEKVQKLPNQEETADKYCCGFLQKRYIFSIVGFLASTLAISLNTNLSLAIVCMVDRSNESLVPVRVSNECLSAFTRDDIKDDAIHVEVSKNERSLGRAGEFHWSPEIEGLALGAAYYGQLAGFLPGGRLAELYGGKRTLIAFLLFASLFTTLTPVAARLSVIAFISCRFLVGVGTAPVIPVLFYMISRWIPESERSFSASFILAGYGTGAFLSFLTAGVLCASSFLGGWPSVFYINGFSGFVWCLLCYALIYEKPEDHPTITSKELQYIFTNLGSAEQKQIKSIPWKSIATSVPFWSLAVGYFGQFWILGFYSTTQALYMGTILHVDSITNGELSCLPHLTRGLFACICGYPTDWALRRGYVSVNFIRKGATLINSIFACMGFVAIMLAGCDPLLNTIFFTVGGLMGDFITFGVCLAGVDIAPNLSGTISGILNIIGAIPFFLIPALVGWSTKHERSMVQWRFVYYFTIAVISTTTILYLLLGTSKPQKWGTSNTSDESYDRTIVDAT